MLADKKYVADFPELMKEWDWDNNNELGFEPYKLTHGSAKKVWWKCPLGHKWNATVLNRTKGRGCPYCSGRKVILGVNDFVSSNPKLVTEWNYEKNNGLTPYDVSAGSHKKVWWKCENGHEWEAEIKSRVIGHGCPYCFGNKVVQGINDLLTKKPEIAAEWNYDKNSNLFPNNVTYGSTKIVWWKCRKGHEWKASVNNRTSSNKGCPYCNLESQTSFPEQAIYYYFNKVTLSYNRYKELGNEIDIYLPEHQIGIEYNGMYYHKNKKEDDKNKIHFFLSKNIRILTVSEGKNNVVSDDVIEYVYSSSNKDSLNWAIRELFILIGIELIDIDVERDTSKIYSQYITNEKENSLLCKCPDIAKEWDYEKNISITPEMVSCASSKKVWWKCGIGHEWQATVSSRSKGKGCPYCSGRIAIEGFNDLATLNQKLLSEWHSEKNGNLLPTMVTLGSEKKVWWKCSKGHEWQAVVKGRAAGNGCPYCSGRNAVIGLNDLNAINPKLSQEWNYEKNGDIIPSMFTNGSSKKVWWKCSLGHEWEATISKRSINGNGCPYCSGNKVLTGFNDLATKYPNLVNEWNYDKNYDLLPSMVASGSSKKVWWKCRLNHEWLTSICSRTLNGTNCPYCSGNKVLSGYNDLATLNQALVKEWDYNKNEIAPTIVSPNSHKKVWWICNKCGFNWESTIANRNHKQGCPKCHHKYWE